MEVATYGSVWVATLASCQRCRSVVLVTEAGKLVDLRFETRNTVRKRHPEFDLYPRSHFGLMDGGAHICRRCC